MSNKFKGVLAKLRMCGFFVDYQHLNNEQLVEYLIQVGRELDEYGDFDEMLEDTDDDQLFSMQVANLDKNKVWWQDLECDVCPENEMYKEVISDFAKLSAGYFNPTNVQELWQTDEGPALVTFEENRKLYKYEAQYLNDWLDAGIIFTLVSNIMKDNDSPYEFYIHEESGQDIFVVRATPDEKVRLEEQLNWVLNK